MAKSKFSLTNTRGLAYGPCRRSRSRRRQAARSAARAAGQAVATAHVPTHATAAANYAPQAIHRATRSADADTAVAQERDWQYQHLLELGKN